MRYLKLLVIVMTGLLVAGIVVMVVGISLGWHKRTATTAESAPQTLTDTPQVITIPHGCLAGDVQASGGFALLRITGGAGCDRIVALDMARGTIASQFLLVPEPTKCLSNNTENPCP